MDYPGPVGVDVKCSMSLLQLDLPGDAVDFRKTRRAMIEAICDRIPTGPGADAHLSFTVPGAVATWRPVLCASALVAPHRAAST